MGEPDAVNLEEEKREEYRHVYPPAIGSIGCGVGADHGKNISC